MGEPIAFVSTPVWIGPERRKICAEFIALAAISTALALTFTDAFNHAVIVSLVRDAAEDHGLDPDDFVRMAEIESGLNPSARHPKSGASGLFQFLPSTARQYKLNAVFNAQANARAAAALWQDNAKELRRSLGRSPTPGEMYLAHQQGATGAASLLANPYEPATEIVGYRAVTMNGGGDEMTAGAFAAMWIDRFERD